MGFEKLKELFMTQREFIDKLKTRLSGKVSTGTLQENAVYYEQYFAGELRQGKTEEEVCASLGSPQLIAKSILEAEKFQSETGYRTDYEGESYNGQEDYHTSSRKAVSRKSIQLPGWCMLIIAVAIFFFVISLVISVFSALAPIIVPICIVLFIVHIFQNNFR